MNPTTLERDFRLGEWVVQPHANIVAGPEGDARVEPRAMQVLALLAGRAGDVVSKEEILEPRFHLELARLERAAGRGGRRRSTIASFSSSGPGRTRTFPRSGKRRPI